MERQRGSYGVGALAGRFRDAVAGGIEVVGVVARSTGHAVVTGAADQRIVAASSGQGIVAPRSAQRIVAAGSGQGVVPGTARNTLVAGVPGTGEIARPDELQGLDVCRQYVTRAGCPHHIRPRSGGLGDDVPRRIHDIGVVAGSPDQRVVSGTAIQGIVSDAPGQDVAEGIARAREVGRPGVGDILDIRDRRQAVGGETRRNGVRAFARVLHDDVAGRVHDEHVVAGAPLHAVAAGPAGQAVVPPGAGQGVVTCSAVQGIVAGPARNRVVGRTARAVERASANVGDILDRAGHRVRSGCGPQGVYAAGIGNDIPGAVDDVGVVARTTDHAVVAGAAIQPVVARAASQGVVARKTAQRVVAGAAGETVVSGIPGPAEIAGSDEGQPLDVRREHVAAGGGTDGIGAFAGKFGDDIGGIIDQVRVIVGAADQRVGAGAAVKAVIAGAAQKPVVSGAPDHRVIVGTGIDRIVSGTAGDGIRRVVGNEVEATDTIEKDPFDLYPGGQDV